MPGPTPDYARILQELTERGVDFIVIGGVAAALQGAPITTFDLDIAHSRESHNPPRLINALRNLDAYYREHPAKRPAPSAADLAGPGHHLLMTLAGPLDLLGAVSGGRGYNDLLPYSIEMDLKLAARVKVLDLPMLITLKEELNRDKDAAALPILKCALREREKK